MKDPVICPMLGWAGGGRRQGVEVGGQEGPIDE